MPATESQLITVKLLEILADNLLNETYDSFIERNESYVVDNIVFGKSDPNYNEKLKNIKRTKLVGVENLKLINKQNMEKISNLSKLDIVEEVHKTLDSKKISNSELNILNLILKKDYKAALIYGSELIEGCVPDKERSEEICAKIVLALLVKSAEYHSRHNIFNKIFIEKFDVSKRDIIYSFFNRSEGNGIKRMINVAISNIPNNLSSTDRDPTLRNRVIVNSIVRDGDKSCMQLFSKSISWISEGAISKILTNIFFDNEIDSCPLFGLRPQQNSSFLKSQRITSLHHRWNRTFSNPKDFKFIELLELLRVDVNESVKGGECIEGIKESSWHPINEISSKFEIEDSITKLIKLCDISYDPEGNPEISNLFTTLVGNKDLRSVQKNLESDEIKLIVKKFLYGENNNSSSVFFYPYYKPNLEEEVNKLLSDLIKIATKEMSGIKRAAAGIVSKFISLKRLEPQIKDLLHRTISDNSDFISRDVIDVFYAMVMDVINLKDGDKTTASIINSIVTMDKIIKKQEKISVDNEFFGRNLINKSQQKFIFLADVPCFIVKVFSSFAEIFSKDAAEKTRLLLSRYSLKDPEAEKRNWIKKRSGFPLKIHSVMAMNQSRNTELIDSIKRSLTSALSKILDSSIRFEEIPSKKLAVTDPATLRCFSSIKSLETKPENSCYINQNLFMDGTSLQHEAFDLIFEDSIGRRTKPLGLMSCISDEVVKQSFFIDHEKNYSIGWHEAIFYNNSDILYLLSKAVASYCIKVVDGPSRFSNALLYFSSPENYINKINKCFSLKENVRDSLITNIGSMLFGINELIADSLAHVITTNHDLEKFLKIEIKSEEFDEEFLEFFNIENDEISHHSSKEDIKRDIMNIFKSSEFSQRTRVVSLLKLNKAISYGKNGEPTCFSDNREWIDILARYVPEYKEVFECLSKSQKEISDLFFAAAYFKSNESLIERFESEKKLFDIMKNKIINLPIIKLWMRGLNISKIDSGGKKLFSAIVSDNLFNSSTIDFENIGQKVVGDKESLARSAFIRLAHASALSDKKSKVALEILSTPQDCKNFHDRIIKVANDNFGPVNNLCDATRSISNELMTRKIRTTNTLVMQRGVETIFDFASCNRDIEEIKKAKKIKKHKELSMGKAFDKHRPQSTLSHHEAISKTKPTTEHGIKEPEADKKPIANIDASTSLQKEHDPQITKIPSLRAIKDPIKLNRVVDTPKSVSRSIIAEGAIGSASKQASPVDIAEMILKQKEHGPKFKSLTINKDLDLVEQKKIVDTSMQHSQGIKKNYNAWEESRLHTKHDIDRMESLFSNLGNVLNPVFHDNPVHTPSTYDKGKGAIPKTRLTLQEPETYKQYGGSINVTTPIQKEHNPRITSISSTRPLTIVKDTRKPGEIVDTYKPVPSSINKKRADELSLDIDVALDRIELLLSKNIGSILNLTYSPSTEYKGKGAVSKTKLTLQEPETTKKSGGNIDVTTSAQKEHRSRVTSVSSIKQPLITTRGQIESIGAVGTSKPVPSIISKKHTTGKSKLDTDSALDEIESLVNSLSKNQSKGSKTFF